MKCPLVFYLHQHKRIHLEKLREREKHVIRTQKIGHILSFKYIKVVSRCIEKASSHNWWQKRWIAGPSKDKSRT